MILLVFLATCLLAYSNGANDNFKGVASLFGSRTTDYRTAIGWATVSTVGGSICSLFLARNLLKAFSGKGLVPDRIAGSDHFLLAVALGAAATVILATWRGLPISTTHGLTGAIVGTGFCAAGFQINFRSLEKSFLLPLLLSPFLAVVLSALLYPLLRFLRIQMGITKEWCLCVGERQQFVPIPQPASAAALWQSTPAPAMEICTGEITECSERYAGTFLGIGSQKIMNALHFLSAGVVSFARGLNDTPKIVALLLVVEALDIHLGTAAVAAAIAAGGLLNARKVAETMSWKVTAMNHGQGLSANLSTGILVILASTNGLPVSTTHVSVGALFGIGLTRREVHKDVIRNIALSWVLTLPCAALIGGLIWWLSSHT